MKNITLVGLILCASGLLALSFNANSGLKYLEGEPDWESITAQNAELEKQQLELLMKQLEEEERRKEEERERDSKG
ncbi:hypothetical protein L2755_02835 [Shewanella abyssi]|uniref:hypothetical protein n=1 Tax=Shewanella abyssi TaxID=311789 RepID=UPI00200F5F89|nr:hypothetical protein [Shewanella abyssi]MCL1048571.1 hypothetical protein [Shewanella abyssi]